MSMILASLIKTVASAGTSEALGASSIEFQHAQFLGYKANGTANTGDVYILDGNGGPRIATISSAGVFTKTAEIGGYFTADTFHIDAATSGDGVIFQYQMEGFKTWNNIEAKLESAMLTVGLTAADSLPDCTFTKGFTVQQRALPNINFSISGATERRNDSGIWECAASIEVRSNVDEDGADEVHSVRVAYVRDLFLDTMLPELLGGAEPNLGIQGVSGKQTSQQIDGRVFVSDLTMSIIATGKTIE